MEVYTSFKVIPGSLDTQLFFSVDTNQVCRHMGSSNTLVLDQADSLLQSAHSFIEALPAESKLLIKLMCPNEGDIRDSNVDKILVNGTVQWDELIRLGRKHGGMPLFYRGLKNRPNNLVPQDIKILLQKDFHRIGLLITMQIQAMKKVIDRFYTAGIPLLFFKGLQLGKQAYGNPIWRKPGDLDILIHADNFEPAKQALLDLGFDARLTESQEKEQIERQQQLTFFGTSTDVDVHFSLQQRSFLKMSYAATFDSEDVWNRAESIELNDVSIPCLSPEDQFCLLCVHSAKHGWYRLYMLADIAAFMTHVKLNWGKASIRAKRIKAERMLGLSVLLANQLFQTPIPLPITQIIRNDPSLAALSSRILRRLFDEEADDKPFQFHRIQAGLFPRWSEKALYLGYVTAEHWKRKLARL